MRTKAQGLTKGKAWGWLWGVEKGDKKMKSRNHRIIFVSAVIFFLTLREIASDDFRGQPECPTHFSFPIADNDTTMSRLVCQPRILSECVT